MQLLEPVLMVMLLLVFLKADFIQYELKEDNSRIDENRGSVWMSAPNKFRWHYLLPMEQLIIADGDKVWVYDEDLEQVTVKPQDNELNPIYVLINGDKSDHYYETKYESSEGAGTWISMTPTKRSDEVKTVWLKIENKQLKTIKLVNHFDQVIVFEFKNIERNVKIPDEMFHFEVPKGVDVISAEALTSSK
ncbi:MAG: outer membrane lipoprotein chaperone LolA [Proteobacteria bacterium]|nr:outer membrane lipoprotein chaperone LolA [Pseudomonadota bacterium]